MKLIKINDAYVNLDNIEYFSINGNTIYIHMVSTSMMELKCTKENGWTISNFIELISKV